MIKFRYIQPNIYNQIYITRNIQTEIYKKEAGINPASFKVLVN